MTLLGGRGGLLETALYQVRRNHHFLRPSTYLSDFSDVPIESPIFLLGFQGGGTTLVSRMLRRNPDVVSCTGNHRYWSGAGEMHTVMGPLLPQALTGTRWKVPARDHPVFRPPRSWTYASDELLEYYRGSASDATAELERALKRVLRMCISRYAEDPGSARFHDKSQVYTVKVGLLKELLADHDPRFVLLLMNPYVAAYKSAAGRVADMARYKEEARLTLAERIEVCSQHWRNSVEAALADGGRELTIVRFEDLLSDPMQQLQMICEHTHLRFDPEMVPRSHHEIPRGSRFPERWYPLRPSRPEGYLGQLHEELGEEGLAFMESYLEPLASKFGYTLETTDREG